ncbi:hypothetical protein I4U23_011662 [Adineta vaga]|nr:hypothetical protein I4U23_011662 [Adineta vaga]
MSASVTTSFSCGQMKTTTKEHSHTISTTVPVNSKMSASLLIFADEIDIPFMCQLIIVYGDGTKVSKTGDRGTFQRLNASRVIAEYGKGTSISKRWL